MEEIVRNYYTQALQESLAAEENESEEEKNLTKHFRV